MTVLDALAPTAPWAGPMLYACLLFGLRYLVVAGFWFVMSRPVAGRGGGRAHAVTPGSRFDVRSAALHEAVRSAVAIGVFTLVYGVCAGWQLDRWMAVYLDDRHPLWWIPVSIVLALLLHDTLFYWLHRLMHTRALFRRVHLVHHRSIHPTSFAAYCFHPLEALLEGLAVLAVFCIVPMHLGAMLAFETIGLIYNCYGHCGREFYPVGWGSHPLGRWLNSSSNHAHHHLRGSGNYGLYFMVWDHLMGTAVEQNALQQDAPDTVPMELLPDSQMV
ncbi:sterol desaturase family protein [Pseudaquabacterium rugosum]|jgi:sterol desaturase/sphingolipid hydroxylase (fatty acid hydroxylase superfamily)|uniref:Sterol desaturase family protein n=1 Tax=Pseudaquabacterium rugosum TaxID=2984194 RepID=A0ABU9B9B0_9BURK